MKRTIIIVLAVFLACGAYAAKKNKELSFDKIGVGLIIGDPFGFTAKLWIDDTNAIDAALALNSTAKFHLQADYVWHNYDLLKVKASEDKLALYYGPGALVRIAQDSSFVIGARGVFGVTYIFKDAPFDTFVELAPCVFITPSMHLTLLGGLGARFYF
ncbi:MAG: hypothetical protein WCI43_05210 [Candidatus Firestonebacteria bacterium]